LHNRVIIQSQPFTRKNNMLNFRSLHLATASLAEALDESKLRPADNFVRDAAIQRFEYTYELCVKSLRRQLEAMSDSPAEVDALGYRDMIRVGVERGLIATEADWFTYRELRNITAHVYDPAKAAQVFAKLPKFLRAAQALHSKLTAASA
jgi:nucleotidyltransferase substrate binding protein (TIGR01987 family)